MNYRTVRESVAQDRDCVVFDLGSVCERLSALPDHCHRRAVRYYLAVILLAALVVELAGQDTPDAIADWVKLRSEFFVESFQVKAGTMPHAMTYRRVLAEASLATALDALTRDYLLSQPATGDRVHIALDGKTLREVCAADQTRALHLLGAYLPRAGIVLMQAEVAVHTNEIPVAPHVLKALDLQGKIVTGDALLAQRELSQVIMAAGGDYLWTVKNNQSRLRQDIEQLLAPETCLPGTSPVITAVRTTKTVEKSHGRVTTRILTTCSLLAESSDWSGVQQVFKVERRNVTTTTTGETQAEIAYGVTSLTPGRFRRHAYSI